MIWPLANGLHDGHGRLVTRTTPEQGTTSYSYNAAGNRTSMTDGLGSVSYNYNNLGQLGSETRSFNGVGTYTLS
ncbi:MAG: RHS repeat domain-containing protein, partial [Pyrinomonadaceae bacterium]